MEIIKQRIGGFSGTAGCVAGGKRKLKPAIGTQVPDVKHAKVQKPLCRQSRFSAVTSFLRTIHSFLQIGYREYAWEYSGFNAAVSYALKNAVSGDDGNADLDYRRMRVARGSLTIAKGATVTVADGKLLFAWRDNSGTGNAAATDTAMLLAYNKKRREAVYRIGKATRVDGHAELILPVDWGNAPMAVYLSFCSAEKQSVANSICLLDDAVESDR